MIASRFWFGLLALLLSGAILLSLLAISMHNRLGVRMVAEGLSADSRVVSWSLKNEAREGAAQLIRFAGNDSVARSLATASRAADINAVDASLRRQLKGTLTQIASELPKGDRFDAVFAVDQSGEVVAHIGFEQASGLADFELGGYPVVADALHGYVRDDTLLMDRLYRVVARPVEFDLGQLPAGAIVGMRVVDDRFASELSERTGAAVAFYSSGRRQAMGIPTGFQQAGLDQIVTDLPSLVGDANYQEKGRTDVHQFTDGLAVVYARLPGEAWQLGAGYAVARQVPYVEGLMGALRHADKKDKEAVSTLLLIALALGAAAVGIGLSFWEYSQPLGAFKRQVKALASGSGAHLAVDKLRGPFRQLGLDLNLALDRAMRNAPEDAPISIGFEQVFGDAPPPSSMNAFGLPPSLPPSTAGAPIVEPPALPQPLFVQPASSQAFPPSPRGLPPRRQPEAAPPLPFGGGGGAQFSPPNAGAYPTANGGGPLVIPPTLPPMDAGYSSGVGEGTLAGGFVGSAALQAATAPFQAPAHQAGNGGAPAEIEPGWTEVYHDFVRIKQDCGEAVEGFTFERFSATLRKNRDTLMREHGVQHVQFSAYVKQGRAALKAKPVRE